MVGAVERFALDRGFLAGMENGQVREEESEKQKPLPFNFRAPGLHLAKDEVKHASYGRRKAK